MRRDGRGAGTLLLAALVATLLLLRALRALFSTAFYESLVTLRLNASALWMLALLAPAVPLPARAARPLLAAAGVAGALLAPARFTDAYLPASALAAALALAALAALLRDPRVRALAAGIGAGLAADCALLLLGRSMDPTLGAAGALAALALGVAAALVAHPRGEGLSRAQGGALLALWLLLEIGWLGNAYGLARWTGAPARVVALAGIAGLLAGSWLALRHDPPPWLALLGGAAAVALVAARSAMLWPALLVAQAGLAAALPALLARGRRGAPGLGLAVALAPLAFLAVFFEEPRHALVWTWIVPIAALALVALARSAPHAPHGRSPVVHLSVAGIVLAAGVGAALAPAAATAPAPPESAPIKVMTYNVHQAFGNRGGLDPDVFERVLRAESPDVVLLQESATPRLSSGQVDIVVRLAERLGYHAAMGESAVAVLTRVPLAAAAPREATTERPWFYEAGVVVGNRTLWLHGIHLSRDPATRALEVERLLAAGEARGDLVLVGGDVNSCPPGGACFRRGADGTYDRLTSAYQDAWVAAGHDATDPAGATHHARAPSRRIDVILAGDGLEVLDAYVVRSEDAAQGSDHLPLVALVRPKA